MFVRVCVRVCVYVLVCVCERVFQAAFCSIWLRAAVAVACWSPLRVCVCVCVLERESARDRVCIDLEKVFKYN